LLAIFFIVHVQKVNVSIKSDEGRPTCSVPVLLLLGLCRWLAVSLPYCCSVVCFVYVYCATYINVLRSSVTVSA